MKTKILPSFLLILRAVVTSSATAPVRSELAIPSSTITSPLPYVYTPPATISFHDPLNTTAISYAIKTIPPPSINIITSLNPTVQTISIPPINASQPLPLTTTLTDGLIMQLYHNTSTSTSNVTISSTATYVPCPIQSVDIVYCDVAKTHMIECKSGKQSATIQQVEVEGLRGCQVVWSASADCAAPTGNWADGIESVGLGAKMGRSYCR